MKNTAKTAVLLAGLSGFFLFIGATLGGTTGMFIALIAAFAMIGFSYWKSDALAIRSARAVPADEAQFPQYYEIMRDLTQRADMPMPRLYITPDPQPNAFATGRNPDNAVIAVTAGLLQYLSWDEVRGVLAHELAHVKNRDILIGSVAAAIATAITFIANIAQFALIFGGGNNRDRNPLADLAMIIVAPIAAALLQMAISRSREFQADRSAAQLIGDGEPLARALEKISSGAAQMPMKVNPAQEQMYIANPLGPSQVAGNLFRTHPPMEERIRRLRSGEWQSALG
ncbi:MAG: zinc metalloprotease HtpX [Actinomycetota bacterium]